MKSLTVLFFIILSIGVRASHIVGGEITYKYISKAMNGSVTYKVNLSLYLDCLDGTPGSIASDAKNTINVFDAQTRAYLPSLGKNVTRQNAVRVSLNTYKCLKNTPTVCVDMYVYEVDMVLPKRSSGYVLTFERCCRNIIITNIINPGTTGATYWTEIKPEANIGANSSPVFKSRPPVFLCLNAPFAFDHSATDEDGDSLAYELFTPYYGASATNSQPPSSGTLNFPRATRIVTWSSSFSESNQMGGNPILEIDELTGRITTTPTFTGQYVVGIKVKEFRKGVLIGETKRDYQFNVDNCIFSVISVFYTAKVNCTNSNVSFTNQSQGATNYHWAFGDSKLTNDTSNLKSPTYSYSSPGIYKITLISKSSVCIDTFDYFVTIKTKINVNLGRDTIFCQDASLKLDAQNPGKQFLWSNSQNTQTITVTQTGKYSVRVEDSPCEARDTLSVIIDRTKLDAGNDTAFCSDNFNPFIYTSPNIYKDYLWNTGENTPTAYIKNAGKYWLTIINQNNCKRTDTIEVFHSIPPLINLKDTLVCIGFPALFDVKIPYYTYEWNTGENTRQISPKQLGLYFVNITNGFCNRSDSAVLNNIVPGLRLVSDTSFCGPFKYMVQTNKPFQTYLWTDGSVQRNFTANKEGRVTVTVSTIEGCIDTAAFNIINYPQLFAEIKGDTNACASSVIDLKANDSMLFYRWNTGQTSQSIKILEEGKFSVIIIDKNNCTDTAYKMVKKNPNAFPNEIYMPNAFTPNGDLLNEGYPDNKFHDISAFYSLKIYNRWGEKIFEASEPGKNWDGYSLNKLSQSGVYIYTLSYLGCDNTLRNKGGMFYLIR